jgi:hypothetical protein
VNYSKEKVRKAGVVLLNAKPDSPDYQSAFDALNWWRLQHSEPLRAVQTRVRDCLLSLGMNDALVVQRLKRAPSIINKLKIQEKMNLSRMQDIAGCRVVLRNLQEIQRFESALSQSKLAAAFVRKTSYIDKPKSSGYRGIHYIYKYKIDGSNSTNGHFVELQVRTRVQHSWATAVEIISLFRNEHLKSSHGSEDWLEFFALASDELAFFEKSPLRFLPRFPTPKFNRLRRLVRELSVFERLAAFSVSAHFVENVAKKKAEYYLLILHPQSQKIEVRTYSKGGLSQASNDYLKFEKDASADVVLVSADSVKSLKEGYQNYFADAQLFIALLKRSVGA